MTYKWTKQWHWYEINEISSSIIHTNYFHSVQGVGSVISATSFKLFSSVWTILLLVHHGKISSTFLLKLIRTIKTVRNQQLECGYFLNGKCSVNFEIWESGELLNLFCRKHQKRERERKSGSPSPSTRSKASVELELVYKRPNQTPPAACSAGSKSLSGALRTTSAILLQRYLSDALIFHLL